MCAVATNSFSERGGWWVIGQFFLMGLVAFAGPYWSGSPANSWLSGLAGALIALGAVIGISGTLKLGRNRTAYPVPKERSQLICHGIYGLIRHPLYSCLILLGAGWAAVWNSQPALVATAVMAGLLRAKAGFEERRLREAFKDYAAYEKRVPRFIPKIARGTLLLLLVLAIGGATVWLLLPHPSVSTQAAWMLGIFVVAALLWLTEALPLFATSLLVIGLEIVVLGNPGDWNIFRFEGAEKPTYHDIVGAAADPIIMLFFGGFLLARAAVKFGVDRSMSALLLRPFGRDPKFVLLGMMSITACFSMWMSNTATTAMMIALAGPFAAQFADDPRFRSAIYLSIPVAANIGGIGTPIASPPNAVAMGYLQQAGIDFSFLRWMCVAVPPLAVLLLLMWGLLWWWRRPATRRPVTPQVFAKPDYDGWRVIGTFVVTVLLWLTDRWHGLPAAVVALLPAILFTASGLLDRTDLNSLEWNVLILIGGGLALGAGIRLAGLGELVVGMLPQALSGNMGWVLLFIAATLLMSTFMSNTAASNLILPVALAATTGIPGGEAVTLQLMLAVALSASFAMALPVSTPPNAIAYAAGEFEARQLIQVGLVLGVLGTGLLMLALPMLLRLSS